MENREGLLVLKAFKAPVANPEGTLTVIRQFRPNDWLSRADWDRFPARSRRTMVNTGFVRDPLNVQINALTNRRVEAPPPKASVTVQHPKRRYDAEGRLVDSGPRGIETATTPGPGTTNATAALVTTVAEPPKRKRGRPPKVKV